MDRRVEITGLCDRTLEQESYHVELGLTHQLNHLGRQEVSVLLEEAISLVYDPAGKVMDGEAHCVRLGSHVKFRFYVVVELLCN